MRLYYIADGKIYTYGESGLETPDMGNWAHYTGFNVLVQSDSGYMHPRIMGNQSLYAYGGPRLFHKPLAANDGYYHAAAAYSPADGIYAIIKPHIVRKVYEANAANPLVEPIKVQHGHIGPESMITADYHTGRLVYAASDDTYSLCNWAIYKSNGVSFEEVNGLDINPCMMSSLVSIGNTTYNIDPCRIMVHDDRIGRNDTLNPTWSAVTDAGRHELGEIKFIRTKAMSEYAITITKTARYHRHDILQMAIYDARANGICGVIPEITLPDHRYISSAALFCARLRHLINPCGIGRAHVDNRRVDVRVI